MFTRTDGSFDRYEGLQVRVMKNGADEWVSSAVGTTYQKEYTFSPPAGTRGDQVKVTIDGHSTWLHLAEVRVMNRFIA